MGKRTFATDDECELEERESELIKKGYVLSNKGELRPGSIKRGKKAIL